MPPDASTNHLACNCRLCLVATERMRLALCSIPGHFVRNELHSSPLGQVSSEFGQCLAIDVNGVETDIEGRFSKPCTGDVVTLRSIEKLQGDMLLESRNSTLQ